MTVSCLKWIGGKGGYKTDEYLVRVPDHKIFISEFCGACHFELSKKDVPFELVNDKNDQLVNFLLMLRDRPEELYLKCEGLPYSESLYNKYKFEPLTDNPLENAVRFYYIVRAGFSGGGHKYKTGFSVSIRQGGSKAKAYRNSLSLMQQMADRIKTWHILNRDFEDVARKYDHKESFHFMDPPYFGCEDLYKGGFKVEDHERLRNTVEDLKGKVMICYYDHPEIRKLYKGWTIHEFDTRSNIRPREVGEKLEVRKELIIMNYNPGGKQLSLL